MAARRDYFVHSSAHQARGKNKLLRARVSQKQPKQARRSITGERDVCLPFAPPEDWHETTNRDGYRIVKQAPGPGFRHIVTPDQIRARLARVPSPFLEQLEIIQLSRMTRKKQRFPCYGMQWGNALYLYPLEESLVEQFDRPPRPSLMNEARMFGGQWDEPAPGLWTLTWSEQAAQDFYLNNILIHELGHLVDGRNTSYVDRERYAEWFAIEYGYLASGGTAMRQPRQVVRRHHAK